MKRIFSSKLFRKLSWIIIVAAMVVYLPSLFVYQIHPGQWWVMGILSIGFPFTWFTFIMAVWFGFKKNKTLGWFLLLLWCAGFFIIQHVVALHPPKDFVIAKPAGSLRIMQWNCMQIAGTDKGVQKYQQERFEAVQWLRKYNPDILTLQDFQNYESEYMRSSIALLRDTLGYRYYYFKPAYVEQTPWGKSNDGVAIFSKLPFIDSGSIQYTGKKYPSYIAWATVLFNNKPLRVATTHFTSMNLNSGKVSADTLNYVQKEDSIVLKTGSKWKKLQYYQPYHVQQAKVLRAFLDTASLPVALGIDMNSVPSSYVYKLVKGNRIDAFLEAGNGFGKSYFSRLPNLRIDYLLMDESIQTNQLQLHYLRLSDHLLLLADVSWKQ
jgi:endonuclease/exonuclease/phosphatase family metal-dependent hydrolase